MQKMFLHQKKMFPMKKMLSSFTCLCKKCSKNTLFCIKNTYVGNKNAQKNIFCIKYT